MQEAPTPPLPACTVPAGELEPGQALPCVSAPRKRETIHKSEMETCYTGTNKSAGKLMGERLRYSSSAP